MAREQHTTVNKAVSTGGHPDAFIAASKSASQHASNRQASWIIHRQHTSILSPTPPLSANNCCDTTYPPVGLLLLLVVLVLVGLLSVTGCCWLTPATVPLLLLLLL